MKFRCSLYCKIPANIETQFEKSSKTIDIFLSVSGYISCNASTLQSLAQLHGEWKLPVGFLFLSFRLASTVLSLCFHRFSNVSLIRGRVALRYAAGRFLEKERPSVVRSIKIYACATSLQQARTLFWRQSRKRSPPPLVSSFFVAIAGKGLAASLYLLSSPLASTSRGILALSFRFFFFFFLIFPSWSFVS